MSENRTKPDSHDRGCFSARRKTEAVLRLLRGEDLDTLSRELGVTAATLSSWRNAFLDGGTAAMKSRPADDRDELVARLQAMIGQLCGAGTWVAPGAGTWVAPGAGTWVIRTGPLRFYSLRGPRSSITGTHRTRWVE
jgi:transposase